jgi:hypothetical protein
MKILKYPTLLFSLILFFKSSQCFAYDLTLSLGNLCEYIGQIQIDDNGTKNKCTFNPYIAGAIDYPLSNQLILSPEYGFSAPKSGRDENITKMSLFALANVKYKFSSMHLIGGLGYFITRIQGDGGEEELQNGNSTVSFPLPDTTAYSVNLILNLGLGFDFNKDWSADLHSFVFNTLTTEDRAYSFALNGTYHFGEF